MKIVFINLNESKPLEFNILCVYLYNDVYMLYCRYSNNVIKM